MDNQIEIELKVGSSTLFEYHSNVSPRIGEIMALDVDENRGLFEVTGVAHNVFRNKKTGYIHSYVTVYIEKAKDSDSTATAQ